MRRSTGATARRMRPGTVASPEARLLRLVDLTYAAATDRRGWTNVLQQLASDLGCELVAFDLQDRDAQWARVQCHVGPQDARLQQQYETYYAARNVFLNARPDLTYTGAIRNGEAIVPDREAVKTEYFNDFLRRIGVLHAIGMVPLREGPVLALLSLMRRIGAPSFSTDDVAFLARFMPHLQRATVMQRRLRGIELERAAATDVLDRLPYGVVLLDDRRAIRFANAAGEAILREGDGLRTLDGRLSAAAPADAEALRRLVDDACAAPGRVGGGAGGFLHVARPSGRRPFALLVAPLRLYRRLLTGRRPAAIVFVTDPERSTPGIQPALRRLHGLTASEADVAERLLAGRSVEEIGADLDTSVHTSRTHLKRILAKTGVRSQAELVRLLLRGPAELLPARDASRGGSGCEGEASGGTRDSGKAGAAAGIRAHKR